MSGYIKNIQLRDGTEVDIHAPYDGDGNVISETYLNRSTAYVKDASVNSSGDTLTITKQDDSTVVFQGGGESSTDACNLFDGNLTREATDDIYRYQFCLSDGDKIIPINTDDNDTSTSKTNYTTTEFNPFEEIFYHNSGGTVSEGSVSDNSDFYYAHEEADLTRTFNVVSESENTYPEISPMAQCSRMIINDSSSGSSVYTWSGETSGSYWMGSSWKFKVKPNTTYSVSWSTDGGRGNRFVIAGHRTNFDDTSLRFPFDFNIKWPSTIPTPPTTFTTPAECEYIAINLWNGATNKDPYNISLREVVSTELPAGVEKFQQSYLYTDRVASVSEGYHADHVAYYNPRWYGYSNFRSIKMPCQPNTYYTLSWEDATILNILGNSTDFNVSDSVDLDYIILKQRGVDAEVSEFFTSPITIKTPDDCHYLIIGFNQYNYPINVSVKEHSGEIIEQGTSTYLVSNYSEETGKARLYYGGTYEAPGTDYIKCLAYSIPETDNGLIYKYIGQAVGNGKLSLATHKPVFKYINGRIVEFTGLDEISEYVKNAQVNLDRLILTKNDGSTVEFSGGGGGGGTKITPDAYKHYRLTITDFRRDGVQQSWATIAEFRLYDREKAVISQTASGVTHSASSVFSSTYAIDYAFDGDTVSRWRSADGSTTNWLQVDFATAERVYYFSIVPHNQSTNTYLDVPVSFTLSASNDGTTWSELHSETGLTTGWSRGTTRVFKFPWLTLYDDLGWKPSINGHILTGTSQAGGKLGLGTGVGVYWASGAYSSRAQLAAVNNRVADDGYAYLPVVQSQSYTGGSPSLAKFGLVGVVDGLGITTTTYSSNTIPGVLKTTPATDEQIENRNTSMDGANLYNQITPRRIDLAVREVLSNYKPELGGEWTSAEKTNARTLLGINANRFILRRWKYYQVNFLAFQRDGSAQTWANIAEFGIVDAQGTNIARTAGAVYSADSVAFSSTVANAFDGSATTIWHSNTTATTHWLRVELPEALVAVKFYLTPRAEPENNYLDIPTAIEIMGSNDGSSWTTLYAEDELTTGWSRGVAREFTQLATETYDTLINRPQINGVTLTGNKTSTDLGITPGPSTYLKAASVSGNTLTITNQDDVPITFSSSGGGEPSAYIKSAAVSGNTLTLIDKTDTQTVFTPSVGQVDWQDIANKPSKFSASTVLLNVSSSSQQTIPNFMDYTYIIAVIYHTSESSHFAGIVIPCRKISTSSTGAGFGTSTTSPGDLTNVGNFFQGASDTVYASIAAWYSGTTGYLTVRGATSGTSYVRFRCIIGVK